MKKSLICLALSLAYCSVLTGCGGGTGTTAIITPTPTPTPVPTVEQRVDNALIVSESITEVIEPEAIDTASDSESETAEPKSL